MPASHFFGFGAGLRLLEDPDDLLFAERLFFMTPLVHPESEDNWINFRVSPHEQKDHLEMVSRNATAEYHAPALAGRQVFSSAVSGRRTPHAVNRTNSTSNQMGCTRFPEGWGIHKGSLLLASQETSV